MRKIVHRRQLHNDAVVPGEALAFIRDEGVQSVAMIDRIIGCPHEEGIDYPEGEACPE